MFKEGDFVVVYLRQGPRLGKITRATDASFWIGPERYNQKTGRPSGGGMWSAYTEAYLPEKHDATLQKARLEGRLHILQHRLSAVRVDEANMERVSQFLEDLK